MSWKGWGLRLLSGSVSLPPSALPLCSEPESLCHPPPGEGGRERGRRGRKGHRRTREEGRKDGRQKEECERDGGREGDREEGQEERRRGAKRAKESANIKGHWVPLTEAQNDCGIGQDEYVPCNQPS